MPESPRGNQPTGLRRPRLTGLIARCHAVNSSKQRTRTKPVFELLSVGGMVLIQMLLPATPTDTNADGPSAINETARELRETFGGLTAYTRAPAKGSWTGPDGSTEQDQVVMIEVVTERFDRAWWKQYSGTLAGRFDQEAIHVRALPIELLDSDAS